MPIKSQRPRSYADSSAYKIFFWSASQCYFGLIRGTSVLDMVLRSASIDLSQLL